MATINIEHLRSEGPSPKSELPGDIYIGDKEQGLAVFKLRGSGQTRLGGPITWIYYLASHDKETVIRAFLEVNPDFVEEKTRKGFHRMVRSHGLSWGEAAREVSSDYFGQGENPKPEGWIPEEQDCPLCGATFYGALANHLEAECKQ